MLIDFFLKLKSHKLPVVWAVAKGSLINKAILVPAALAISAAAPWAVLPLLMVGGAYLCFEGFEKVAHKLLHTRAEDQARHAELIKGMSDLGIDPVSMEKEKIKGAIRTDFILSAEIVVISLGIVAEAEFLTQVAVLVGIALMMTAGVYGLVAGIVKLDDAGLWLSRRGGAQQRLGAAILWAAPWLMKLLSIAGTAAMFLVGGGILVHGIAPLHHWLEGSGAVASALGAAAVGGLAGGAALGGVLAFRRLRALARRRPDTF